MKLDNDSDHLFKEIRDCSLPKLGEISKIKQSEIKKIVDMGELKFSSVDENNAYILQVKNMKVARTKELLEIHTNLA